MELLSLPIIVLGCHVLILEVISELALIKYPFINFLHLYKILSPNQGSTTKIEDGNPILFIFSIVMDLEMSFHSQNPCFN